MPSALFPDHRAREVQRAYKYDQDVPDAGPHATGYFYFLRDGTSGDRYLDLAVSLYMDDDSSHVMDAALLANTQKAVIAEYLAIHEEAVSIYANLFFDNGVFQSNFDRIKYVNTLDGEVSKKYILAMERGGLALLRQYRVGERAAPDPVGITEDLLDVMYERAASTSSFSIVSAQAKEGLRWAEASLRAAKQLSDMRDGAKSSASGLSDELRIALKIENRDMSPMATGIKVDDLTKS